MRGVYDDRRWLIPFRSQLLPQMFTDTLIIGSGVAGLRCAALSAKHGDVLIITKDAPELSTTAWAQGGIAAAIGPSDDPERHLEDTISAGAGMVDVDAARQLVVEGAEEVRSLIESGFRVDRTPTGAVHFGLEGGHHHSRIVHTDGAQTGRALSAFLLAQARATRGVRLFDHCFCVDLMTIDDASGPRVVGALTWHPRYGLQIIWARSTVLACGGAGHVYRESTNPRTATGDAVALAWRAGADVSDLEFMQFHPTTLYVAGAVRHLLSEAIRGEGARVVTRDGDSVVNGVHPMGDLAPRDVVSRAITSYLAQTGESHVFLDARHLGVDGFRRKFPGIADTLAQFGLDGGRDLLPIHPAAHYTIGGVWTDHDGRASIPGLFACGEAASTGVHGANRLASNSLLEGLVYGRRVGEAAACDGATPIRSTSIDATVETSGRAELDLDDMRSSVRSAMWRHVGIVRDGRRMSDVLEMFGFWGRYGLDAVLSDPSGWEAQNLLTCGRIMAEFALARGESVGTHFRSDSHLGATPQPRRRLRRRGVLQACIPLTEKVW
ncbi:MAG: L-aspartate oxidase [Planctomycetota bacterium]|nr:L-aspartate oxidase [Planctomycetota bacterium]